jgi:cation:H+ antiporter
MGAAIAAALLGFVASGAVVVLAGIVLARSSDVIAARTRLGRVWVGSIFLAAATSLPELSTDIAAVRIGAADLAAGDIFGSSMANMLILAGIAVRPGVELFRRAARDHALSAALAIVMNSVAALAILSGSNTTLLGLEPGSLLLLLAYIAGTRMLFRHSVVAQRAGVTTELAGAAATPPEARGRPRLSLRGAIARFLVAALMIVLAAPVFAHAAARLAQLTGITTSLIGTWLVGITTSLPELATSVAAIRMGAVDLAIGNLLGSNAFNAIVFVPLDLAYGGASLFDALSVVHVMTALVGILMTAVALGAIIYRSIVPGAHLEPAAFLMMAIYLIGLLLVCRGPG